MKWIQKSQYQPDGATLCCYHGFTSIKLPAVIAIIAILAALCGVAALHAATTFTKITTDPIVTDEGISEGCAWGDYNNDGYDDLFVAVANKLGGQNFLYRNNGDGTFARITTGSIVTDGGYSTACVWGDFDNDGFLDLFVTNDNYFDVARPSFLYHNNGDGTFEKITSGRIATDVRFTIAASWGDYDGDGYIDLFVGNFGGVVGVFPAKNALYHNVSGLDFVPIEAGPIVNEGGRSGSSAWADYNNDGLLDLFVVNWNSSSPVKDFLYRNNGDGTFVKIIAESVGLLKSNRTSVGCAWGDYDNDGFPDLFVCRGGHISAETNSLYRNNGNGTFTEVTSSIVSEAGFYGSGAWGDYDNDGFLDLFLGQLNPGQNNVLYHNNGDGTFTKVLEGSLVNDGGVSHACAWADYDNDGFLDLVVANTDSGGVTYSNFRNFLYHNDGNTNRWIKLKLVGTVSNRAAIGAKVRVKANVGGNAVWQFRDISGGGGWGGGQNSLVAHFGLGDAAIIDTIRIEWPSGIVEEMHNVAVKQFLTVTEPARLQALGPGVLRVQSWKGMTFEVQASTDLTQWSPLTTVTNLTGTLEFTDPDTTNHLHRFYRTVLR